MIKGKEKKTFWSQLFNLLEASDAEQFCSLAAAFPEEAMAFNEYIHKRR